MSMSSLFDAKSINRGTCPPDQDVFDLGEAHPNTLTITAFKSAPSSNDVFKIYCSLCHFDNAYEYLLLPGGPIVKLSLSKNVFEFP